MILVLAFFGSLIPGIILFLWLRGQKDMRPGYQRFCDRALVGGILSVIAAFLMSTAFSIIFKLTGVKELDPLLYRFLHMMILIAFSEELMKFLVMKKAVKGEEHSWFEYAVFMAITAMGFGLAEAIPYAFEGGAIHMFVRGFTLMHTSYGFIIGYFYGKTKKTGQKIYGIIGFLIAWLLHGLYDFSLSDEFEALNDNLVFIPFLLTFISVVMIIVFIRFVRKRRNDPKYTELA